MDQSQTKSLLSKTSETETPRGLIGLNEEEIEIELQTNTYAIDRNKTVVIIEPESIYDLQIGTFLKPPPLTKNHNDPEGLFLEDLPNETLYKIFEYVPIQKLGYLSMTCSGFDELLDDDDFWIKVAQFNDHLFIWKSLKIYSNSEGNSSIIGSLNDSIIVHNNNYENVFEKRISEGSFTKFLRSRSIGLFELSEKMGLIKKKSLCKPHTNKRIRVEYIKSLLNSRYETIERYTFLKNACKLKKVQDELSNQNYKKNKLNSFWKTVNKLFSVAFNFFWVALFIFGILLNLKINGKIQGQNSIFFTFSPLIIFLEQFMLCCC